MFLYVIGDGEAVKLGFSKHPEKRLKQLQTAHPKPLTLHHTELFSSETVKLYERAIHKELGHLKLKGEWFNLTPEEATLQVKHLRIFYSEQEYRLKE